MAQEVASIRRRVAAGGVCVAECTDWALNHLYKTTGDNMGLTVDALLMDPRPLWVKELCGEQVLTADKSEKSKK